MCSQYSSGREDEAVPGSAASGAQHYLEAFNLPALGISEGVTDRVGIKEDLNHTDLFSLLCKPLPPV